MIDPEPERPIEAKRPAAELMPMLYAELRTLASEMIARLSPGQTLQSTALVHEAYLRLVRDRDPGWEGRRHFFGAAARAMREILIEQARHKGSIKKVEKLGAASSPKGWPGSNHRRAMCLHSTRRFKGSRRRTLNWRRSYSFGITPA